MKKNMKNQKGFSLVELLVVVIIIGIIAAIAIPSLLKSRVAANEANAISSMRNFHSANLTYQATDGNGSFGTDAAALGGADVIDDDFAAAIDAGTERSGFQYDYTGGTSTYELTGANQGTTANLRSFAINESGVLFYCAGATCTAATGTALGQ